MWMDLFFGRLCERCIINFILFFVISKVIKPQLWTLEIVVHQHCCFDSSRHLCSKFLSLMLAINMELPSLFCGLELWLP